MSRRDAFGLSRDVGRPAGGGTLSGGPPDSPTDEAVSAQAASSLFRDRLAGRCSDCVRGSEHAVRIVEPARPAEMRSLAGRRGLAPDAEPGSEKQRGLVEQAGSAHGLGYSLRGVGRGIDGLRYPIPVLG